MFFFVIVDVKYIATNCNVRGVVFQNVRPAVNVNFDYNLLSAVLDILLIVDICERVAIFRASR